jgi:hypothetical protein
MCRFYALATPVHAPRGGEALLDAQIAIEIAARTSTRVRSNLRSIARAALFHPFFRFEAGIKCERLR